MYSVADAKQKKTCTSVLVITGITGKKVVQVFFSHLLSVAVENKNKIMWITFNSQVQTTLDGETHGVCYNCNFN